MKVRGTTTFVVDDAVRRDEVVQMVQDVLQRLIETDVDVVGVEVRPGHDQDDVSLELDIVFNSTSYASVETVMHKLASSLRQKLAAEAPSVRVDGRETQLVPA